MWSTASVTNSVLAAAVVSTSSSALSFFSQTVCSAILPNLSFASQCRISSSSANCSIFACSRFLSPSDVFPLGPGLSEKCLSRPCYNWSDLAVWTIARSHPMIGNVRCWKYNKSVVSIARKTCESLLQSPSASTFDLALSLLSLLFSLTPGQSLLIGVQFQLIWCYVANGYVLHKF